MKTSAIMLTFLGLCTLFGTLASLGQTTLPKINFFRVGNDWKRIVPKNATSNTTINGMVLYSKKGDDLFLRCSASYPIQWSFTGFLSPPEIVNIQPPKRNLTENTFQIEVVIFFLDAKKFAGLGASVKISCEKIGDSRIAEAVFVHVMGNDGNPFVQSGTTTTVSDSNIIPCAVQDTTMVPTLYHQTNRGLEKRVEDPSMRYYPTQGFHSNVKFNGLYSCRLGVYSLNFTAFVSPPSNLSDIQFIPQSDSIHVFSEDRIRIECYSKSGRVIKLLVDVSNHSSDIINASYHSNKYGGVTAHLFANFGNNASISTLAGKALCNVNDDNDGSIIVKEWSFEFIQTPELYLDSFAGEMHCLSEMSPKLLQVLRCKNDMDCEFMFGQNCLENVSNCNFKKRKQFYESTDSYCWLNVIKTTRKCVSLPSAPHLSGVAQCTVGGLSKRWTFFTSLDARKYVHWRNAPNSELIRIVETSPIALHTNQTYSFCCMAVAYLFADSISFELEFENGQLMPLEGNGSFWNTSQPGHSSPKKVKGFNIIGTLEIKLPPETIAIHCIAPWWNDTAEGIRTKIVFEKQKPKAATLPRILMFVFLGLLGDVMIFLCVIKMCRMFRKAKGLLRNLTNAEVNEFFEGRAKLLGNIREAVVGSGIVEIVDSMPYDKQLEISLNDIEFDSSENSFLGSGAFSYVVRGRIISKETSVAVKIAKPSADVTMFKCLLSEVKIMNFVGRHENIVTLIGVCTQDIRNRSIHIVTDICELGSLDGYLRKFRPSFVNLINGNQQIDLSLHPTDYLCELSTLNLINFSAQIAKGMEYLASKSVVHGDLAARNVLITNEKIAKISDFGLSRKLYGNLNYVKKSNTPVPWRWMAIESLTSLTFSTCSDVWAFGVTLYEIFTLGNVPFHSEQYDSDFSKRLSGGVRLERPEYCTPEIHTVIISSWEKDPDNRPSFSQLRSFFEETDNMYRFVGNITTSVSAQCLREPENVDMDYVTENFDNGHDNTDL